MPSAEGQAEGSKEEMTGEASTSLPWTLPHQTQHHCPCPSIDPTSLLSPGPARHPGPPAHLLTLRHPGPPAPPPKWLLLCPKGALPCPHPGHQPGSGACLSLAIAESVPGDQVLSPAPSRFCVSCLPCNLGSLMGSRKCVDLQFVWGVSNALSGCGHL